MGIQQPGSRSSGPATAALLHFGGLACVFGAILPPKAFLPADPGFLELYNNTGAPVLRVKTVFDDFAAGFI